MTRLGDVMDRLLESTREGYWLIDNDARTVDVNPAMCEILGLPKDEILRRPVFDFVDRANRQCFTDELDRRAQGHTSVYEIDLLRSDGTTISCVNNACPILDDDGAKIGSVGLWTDISEIKAVQRQLMRAKDKAERANRAKTAFLASMSHELRTPMNSILGFTQLLQASRREPPGETQTRHLGQILKAGEHLLSLIDQLLDLARIESGSLSVELESVSTREAIHDAVEMIRPAAQEAGIAIDVPGTVDCNLFLDRMRIREIMLNLLSNAIKYNTPNGRVDIHVSRSPSGCARITVNDTGQGIPPDRHAEVFQPFNRLGRETSNIQGTGVGLLVTKGLVEAMGGDIGFASFPGEGTSFWVEFPEYEGRLPFQPIEVLDATPASPDLSELSGLILYVEDNVPNIQLMEDLLSEHEEVSLVSASDGESGLELAHILEPDLILLDVHLPTMNGYEVAKKLRSLDECKHTPIVAVTAAVYRRDRERGRAAGFNEYLAKPINVEKVYNVMSRYLA